MHVPNHMVSEPVGLLSMVISLGWFGLIWSKIKESMLNNNKFVIAAFTAFVFAAQMVNFRLPVLNGVSGHFVGASLCTIVFGPYIAVAIMASVIGVQCVFFNDGGLLALGCNILNMALVPAFLTDLIVRHVRSAKLGNSQLALHSFAAGLISVSAGAILVSIQVALSGLDNVNIMKFALTIIGVHLVIGSAEGLINVACNSIFLKNARDENYSFRLSTGNAIITLLVLTLISCTVLAGFACESPDGLEWSYIGSAYQADEGIVNGLIAQIDNIQAMFTPFPDYCFRFMDNKLGTGLCGLIGSAVVAGLYLLTFKTSATKYN